MLFTGQELKQGNIRLNKNIAGSISIPLHDFRSAAVAKNFIIKHNHKHIDIPMAYALSIFSIPEARDLFDKGLLVIDADSRKELLEEAARQGLTHAQEVDITSQDFVVYNQEELLKFLKEGNIAKIDEVIEQDVYSQIISLISLARDNYNSLSVAVIEKVEAKAGISLKVEGA